MKMSTPFILVPVLAMFACADPLSVEGLRCPCAPGYGCRVEDETCVESVAEVRRDGPLRCTRSAPECTQREEIITDQFASADEVADRILGRWLVCEGSDGLEDEDADFMGIEFTEGRRFHLLREVAPGQCERDLGFEREGTWDVSDISEQNQPGTYQVSLYFAGGGAGGMVPSFSAQPLKLRTDWWGEMVADPQ